MRSGSVEAGADGDGMPDTWEKAHGLNPKVADGAALSGDGSGWTNLEPYLADAAKVRG